MTTASKDFANIVTLDQRTISESIARIDYNIRKLMEYNAGSEINQALKRASMPMMIRATSDALALHKGQGKALKGKYMKPKNIMLKIAKSLKPYIQKTRRRSTFHKVRIAINRNSPYMREFVYIAKKSKYKGGRTFIPAAIEYGHIAPNGTTVKAMPYMRPAIAKCQNEVTYAFAREVNLGFINVVNKRAAKIQAA